MNNIQLPKINVILGVGQLDRVDGIDVHVLLLVIIYTKLKKH